MRVQKLTVLSFHTTEVNLFFCSCPETEPSFPFRSVFITTAHHGLAVITVYSVGTNAIHALQPHAQHLIKRTSKSESLKPYTMFQPSMRNFFRSISKEWKKQRAKSSFLYLLGFVHLANCWSVISWYSRFMFALRPWKVTWFSKKHKNCENGKNQQELVTKHTQYFAISFTKTMQHIAVRESSSLSFIDPHHHF